MFLSGKELFANLSFMIREKDRIGLVGKNGAGKSTLLKIIAKALDPTSGTVDISSEKRVGYLPQEMNWEYDKTVFGETQEVFKEVLDLEQELKDINVQFVERTDYESDSYSGLIERLNEIHAKLGTMESEKMESKIEKVLKGLGFYREDFDKPLAEFSGGWQMRVELAKILLTEPDLLLLDEPTNHLDIESILWLEEYFQGYPGAIVMVSHDRRFLDNITNRTIEIVFGKIYDYKSAYSQYLILRQERYDTQIATFKNQQKHIDQQEKFISRFKAKASKSKQVQSKIKMLDKIDRIEMDEFDESSIQFRFPPAPRSGAVVVEANDVDKHYEDKHVLKNLNFKIQRGDRIAFVGKNGMGKTTLVKLITGEEKGTGELILGHNVAQGYYAQVQEKTLRKDATVLETLEDEATGDWTKTNKLRGLLGAFLFRDSDIDKKVKVLSGGEKSRLALARLLLVENNLIILDEPTNHLDMRAKDVLKQALQDFDGTLIIVSHDRDFLSELTTKTFEFTPTGTKEHLGDISEFLDKYKYEHFRELEQTSKAEKKAALKKADTPEPAEKEKRSYENKKTQEKEERQLRSDLNKVEKKIEKLELELAEMENKMSDPTFYDGENEASKKMFFEHAEIQKNLDINMQEWEAISEKIED
tara:strand:+ start:22287 stop:24221 length:1935 start_codon:yes stop_codon:yes gene_type:complete